MVHLSKLKTWLSLQIQDTYYILFSKRQTLFSRVFSNFLLLCNVIVVSKRHYGDKKDMTSKVFGSCAALLLCQSMFQLPTYSKVNDSLSLFVMSKRYCTYFCVLLVFSFQKFCDLLISWWWHHYYVKSHHIFPRLTFVSITHHKHSCRRKSTYT